MKITRNASSFVSLQVMKFVKESPGNLCAFDDGKSKDQKKKSGSLEDAFHFSAVQQHQMLNIHLMPCPAGVGSCGETSALLLCWRICGTDP